jgi:hypothetical protein
MHRLKIILVSLLLAAISGPLLAYTIYLKDGSKLMAREVYRVQEGKAIITLQNGTQTFIDASEIDVERTLNANREGYGTALMLDKGKVVEGPIVREDQKEESLVDLAARGETRARNRPQARRPSAEDTGGRQVTAAGFIDLGSITRRPYPNLEISSEIKRVFLGQGVDAVQIHQGTQPNSPFLEITTDSEASVFRALEVSADALVHIRTRYPELVGGFEVFLITSSRNRAGQFLLTADAASALAEDRIDASDFFVRQVQF